MDIIERINVRCLPYGALALLDEAAEEIRRLDQLAEHNALIALHHEEEIRKLRAMTCDDECSLCDVRVEQRDEIARLQSENERLRKTLQVIADNPTWLDHGPRAQTALAPHGQKEAADGQPDLLFLRPPTLQSVGAVVVPPLQAHIPLCSAPEEMRMDIVRRLEQRRPVSMKEAAENIRKLREENERLRKEIAKSNARESVLYEKCEDWRMEAKRLQADNERLRANAALADENEALRAQLDHVTITYKAEMQEAAEEIRKLQEAWYGRCKIIEERDAEIARLVLLLGTTNPTETER